MVIWAWTETPFGPRKPKITPKTDDYLGRRQECVVCGENVATPIAIVNPRTLNGWLLYILRTMAAKYVEYGNNTLRSRMLLRVYCDGSVS